MWEWILTSGGIAAFAALALEMVREDKPVAGHPLTGDGEWQSSLAVTWGRGRPLFGWETMTEADMDKLMEEFCGQEAVGVLNQFNRT